ncbi:MAG: stage II sporulation protein R [Eubacteriaceae bacterium]|nr:stage II sporulation protein R [Eubacteriaceae bacterium]
MKLSEKIIAACLCAALSALPIFALWYNKPQPQSSANEDYMLLSDSVIRLHIIADSDSPEAQSAKLAVRNYIITSYAPLLETWEGKQSALGKAQQSLPELQKGVNSFLRRSGADCTARIEISRSYFPDKEYDGVAFPAGEYDALKIMLGKGQGQNWWCVLYPPLCFAATDADPVDLDSSEIEIRWKVMEWWEELKAKSRDAAGQDADATNGQDAAVPMAAFD